MNQFMMDYFTSAIRHIWASPEKVPWDVTDMGQGGLRGPGMRKEIYVAWFTGVNSIH